ncbi:glycosyl transferase family 2 [Nitrosococcus halophilus Nc 4]|uniref:Glycosyl transferase family 2 n=1 Tax=Nitrosococcus halophilus (strain Nc4) TaxID=472759 RepID=D5C0N4_NITHN|nr:glycosyltransferase family 2 protein [Nitrosococcus halophilus]ADE16357.1 glycosyl transferase family 2 [Nitrosococcus halophilus Nc 4]
MISISIIIVNYNTRNLLQECLKSVIRNTKDLDCEIIVIDNQSADGSIDMIRSKFPNIYLIANTANQGFAKANNQALAVAKGEYIFFLNPDTIVLNGALAQLFAFCQSDSRIAVVGPRLYKNYAREHHPSIRTFSQPILVILSCLPFSRWILYFYHYYIIQREQIQDVDWLAGAAFMMPRRILDKIGYFDERYFVYSEEEDLCLRAHKAGYRVVYYPPAEVVHLKGKSSEQEPIQASRYFWESKLSFFYKYYPSWKVKSFRWALIKLIQFKKLYLSYPQRQKHDQVIQIMRDYKK